MSQFISEEYLENVPRHFAKFQSTIDVDDQDLQWLSKSRNFHHYKNSNLLKLFENQVVEALYNIRILILGGENSTLGWDVDAGR